MKKFCKYISGLRYKLRMVGIPVDGTVYIFGDNKSVLANSSKPTLVLRKSQTQLPITLSVKEVQLMNGVLCMPIQAIMLPIYSPRFCLMVKRDKDSFK